MYIATRKKTNEVVMHSESDLFVDRTKFNVSNINPTPKELIKLLENWKAYYINGKLEFQENAINKKENKKKKFDLDIKQIKKMKTLDELETLLVSIFENI